MHQNSLFQSKNLKNFWGGGKAPRPFPQWGGGHPSPHHTPSVPAALDSGTDPAPLWNHFKHWLYDVNLYVNLFRISCCKFLK